MGVFDNFPYSNLHAKNLDFLCMNDKLQQEEIEKLWYEFENNIKEQVETYIAENLSGFLLDAMYNEENTAIVLQRVDTNGGGQ